jgi:hypothetical protein
MTENEKKIIARLTNKCGLEELKVVRKSDREYDLGLDGRFGSACPYMGGVSFSAWLPLLAIRELTVWTSDEIAGCSNHPTMAAEGDWSGIRDSEPENIWHIFHTFVV